MNDSGVPSKPGIPPPLSAPPPLGSSPSTPSGLKKRRWLLYGCGGLLALLLIIIATVGITIWWIQRPIKPVVLNPKEQTVVDAKLRELEDTRLPAPTPLPVNPPPQDRPYVPGAKTITLTERELNGLLNQNTDLGKSVRIEFARNAINAYLAVLIPEDVPIMGGKMFRARGRFSVSIGNGGKPYVILEDVTVFGISLPKAWLGGLKGENLLGDAVGHGNKGPILQGIKNLRVEPGALQLELAD